MSDTDPKIRPFPIPSFDRDRETSSSHASSPVHVNVGNGAAAAGGGNHGPDALQKWWQLVVFLLTIALAAGVVVAKVDTHGQRIDHLERQLSALMLHFGVKPVPDRAD